MNSNQSSTNTLLRNSSELPKCHYKLRMNSSSIGCKNEILKLTDINALQNIVSQMYHSSIIIRMPRETQGGPKTSLRRWNIFRFSFYAFHHDNKAALETATFREWL